LQFKVVFIFGIVLSAPLHSVMTRAVSAPRAANAATAAILPRRA
jgi:hypothetical protein